MTQRFNNAKLDGLLRQYAAAEESHHSRVTHLVYLPAIMFAVLGMLFAVNFGIAMVAVAIAILYYSQYGQKIAALLGAAFLVMLAVWMLVMPPHYLVAESLGIFLLALAGRLSGEIRARRLQPSLAAWKQYLLAGPVYALVMIS